MVQPRGELVNTWEVVALAIVGGLFLVLVGYLICIAFIIRWFTRQQ